MKRELLVTAFLAAACLSLAQAGLTDSIPGDYMTCHIQTWIEEDHGDMTVFKTLGRPETLSVCTLSIKKDGTFTEFQYGREAAARSSSRYYGKTFWRTGTWSLSHDTLTMEFKNEKVYEDQDRSHLIEDVDLVKWYKDYPYFRFDQWKFSGNGKLCWKHDYSEYCIERK
jgi:hypothetical protein